MNEKDSVWLGQLKDGVNEISGAKLKPVAWMWKQHGWAVTAHGKHRAIKTSVDVSRPPNCVIESDDFISLEPLCLPPPDNDLAAIEDALQLGLSLVKLQYAMLDQYLLMKQAIEAFKRLKGE